MGWEIGLSAVPVRLARRGPDWDGAVEGRRRAGLGGPGAVRAAGWAVGGARRSRTALVKGGLRREAGAGRGRNARAGEMLRADMLTGPKSTLAVDLGCISIPHMLM